MLFVVGWSDFCLWRVESALSQRDLPAAEIWLQRAGWLGSQDTARMVLLRLRVARRSQNFAEVEQALKAATRLGAPRAETDRERLLAMAQTGQFGAMQHRWSELLVDPRDDAPEIARAYYTWCMIHHNLDEARRTLELWHDDFPQDPEPLMLLGRFYQATLNWEAAEKAYREAVEHAPSDDACRLALADVLSTRLKSDEAIPLFRDYLSRHPRDVSALQGLAQCLATEGDLRESLKLLETALEQQPDDFTALKSYGEMLLLSGDPSAAVEPLQKAYRQVPEHANLANSLARALKATGRAAEAKPLFAFVAESRPKLEELTALERDLRSQPNNLELRMKIAEITARYVSRADARRWYQNLLNLSPNYGPAQEKLAALEPPRSDVTMTSVTGAATDAAPAARDDAVRSSSDSGQKAAGSRSDAD